MVEWRKFRDSLESIDEPLTAVAELWSRAPFVNSYLDPNNPKKWPDPWHLVMDGKFDELAIVLGMLYTIKLTQRFMKTPCEIHTSMLEKDLRYYLVVDNKHVLNYEYRIAHDIKVLDQVQTSIIWRCDQLL